MPDMSSITAPLPIPVCYSSTTRSEARDTSNGSNKQDSDTATTPKPTFTWWRLPLCVHLLLLVSFVSVGVSLFAFLPIFLESRSVFEANGEEYAVQVGSVLSDHVRNYFDLPQEMLTTSTMAFRSGVLTIHDDDSVAKWLAQYTPDNFLSFLGEDATEYGVAIASFGFRPLPPDANPTTSPAYGMFLAPTGTFLVGRFDNRSSVLNLSVRLLSAPLHVVATQTVTGLYYDFANRPYYHALKSSSKRTWTRPSISYFNPLVIMMTGAPLINPNGIHIGTHVVALVVERVLQRLRALPFVRTFTGRFALLDSSSQAFLGGNFDDLPYRIDVSTNVTTGAEVRSGRVTRLCEVKDTLVAYSCLTIGEEVILTCAPPCTFSIIRGYSDVITSGNVFADRRVVVRVEPITDTYQLDLRLLVLIPLDDIMMNTSNGMLISVAASGTALLFLMCLAAVVVYRSLLPLKELESALLEAVSLRYTTDRWNRTTSMFTEIDAVVCAFQRVAEDLRMVRAFLPMRVFDILQAHAELIDNNGRVSGPASDHSQGSSSGQCLGGQATVATTSGTSVHSSRRSSSAVASVSNGGEDVVTAILLLAAANDDTTANNRLLVNPLSSGRQSRAVGGETSRVAMWMGLSSPLRYRAATIVMLNVGSTHSVITSVAPEVFLLWHRHVVSTLLRVATQQRANLEFFYGDHFFLTFNAATRCHFHTYAAVGFVATLEGALMTMMLRAVDAEEEEEEVVRAAPGGGGEVAFTAADAVGRVPTDEIILSVASGYNNNNNNVRRSKNALLRRPSDAEGAPPNVTASSGCSTPDDGVSSASGNTAAMPPPPPSSVNRGGVGWAVEEDSPSTTASAQQQFSLSFAAMSAQQKRNLRAALIRPGAMILHAGMSCGECFYGPMGTAAMMRLTLIGPAVTQANTLMRLCAMHGVGLMFPKAMSLPLELNVSTLPSSSTHTPRANGLNSKADDPSPSSSRSNNNNNNGLQHAPMLLVSPAVANRSAKVPQWLWTRHLSYSRLSGKPTILSTLMRLPHSQASATTPSGGTGRGSSSSATDRLSDAVELLHGNSAVHANAGVSNNKSSNEDSVLEHVFQLPPAATTTTKVKLITVRDVEAINAAIEALAAGEVAKAQNIARDRCTRKELLPVMLRNTD